MDLREITCDDVDWIHLTLGGDWGAALVNTVISI
jgi:hypothetical protein